MCTQFEYKCYFEKHPRKRSKLVEQDAVENGIVPIGNSASGLYVSTASRATPPPREERPSLEDTSKLRSMEANSGMAFTRLLGMRLDASAGPKLFTFGWNLGAGSKTAPLMKPITDLLTKDQMILTAKQYFSTVHWLYALVEEKWLMEQVALRYTTMECVQCPDHVMAGIASLGILFSPGSCDLEAVLNDLVESARLALESTSTMQPPTIYDVQSWTLRTIYLRCTAHPHACWLASSIVMHLVESCGLQQESSSPVMYPLAKPNSTSDLENRRRTFWIARMLNTWVSFEYGRSRVSLRGITCQLPARREGDFSREYLDLYGISCCLDPECLSDKPGQWEDFLAQLEGFSSPHDCIELSKANLGLCAYRRIRLANPNVPADIISRIINIGLGGLKAASRLANKGLPWWHVGNVPFQCICVFLAIDTRESLSNIGTAIRTLEMVVRKFNTQAMKEALKTARFLIRLSKRKKEEDSDVLGQSLRKEVVDGEPMSETERKPAPPARPEPQTQMQAGAMQQPLQPMPMVDSKGWMLGNTAGIPGVDATGMMDANGMDALGPGPLTTSSGEDWNMDYLNNPEFNWNFFLSQDIPQFNGLAPDGQM